MRCAGTFCVLPAKNHAFCSILFWNSIPARVKNIYATWGGTPFLDKNYTVFGKVIKGYYVLDKIQNAERNEADRPKSDIRIKKATLL
jgi:cyclophilin family peptidyl-prolyl cis-trans isomerase